MRIKQFRDTRRWVDDVGAEIGMDLGEVVPGFVYADGLSIEAPAGGAGPEIYRLAIGNEYFTGPLAKMECKLYLFAKSEGYLN